MRAPVERHLNARRPLKRRAAGSSAKSTRWKPGHRTTATKSLKPFRPELVNIRLSSSRSTMQARP
jgi:hypothetical protein